MHAKKVYVGLKRKKQARNLRKLVNFKRKNKIVLKFSIAIMKLNFLVFILIMFHQITKYSAFLDF
jgi:hypothetical protein